jgi:hypothetical protein
MSLIKALFFIFHIPQLLLSKENKEEEEGEEKKKSCLFFLLFRSFDRMVSSFDNIMNNFLFFFLQIFISGQCWIYYSQYDPTTRPFIIIIIIIY